MQSAKIVVISKLTILPECKFTTQNVQWIQFHQHQLSDYFPTLRIYTLKCAIVQATAKLLNWYSATGFSDVVLNQTINYSDGQYSLCMQNNDKHHYVAIFLAFKYKFTCQILSVTNFESPTHSDVFLGENLSGRKIQDSTSQFTFA